MKVSAFIISISLIACISCRKQNSTSSSYSNNPASTSGPDHIDSLSGTKWTLYQYRDNANNAPLPRTDTLQFLSATSYKYNGVKQTYSLYTSDNIYNKYVLILDNTPFGSLRGLPPLSFKTYGEIVDEPFAQYGVTNGQTYNMWFKKIN